MAAQQKKVAILQSNYIPWKGYFDIIAKADVFVVYDVAQYTKHDWRNRNKIKTTEGEKWLTLPVKTSERRFQKIHNVEVLNAGWAEKHLKSFEINYRKAKCYDETMDWIQPLYHQLKEQKYLSVINKRLIKAVCSRLAISTKIIDAEDFQIEGNKSQALLSILQQIGEVASYISGPSARAYLDKELFAQHHIQIEWMDYIGYPVYGQLYLPFVHEVSIVDLLFNEGSDSRSFLKY